MVESRMQHIVTSARGLFLRYGFRRTTMGDIAVAAGISRPALYLVFSSKEEVFDAVLADVLHAQLETIRAGLDRYPTAMEQLRFACEIWVVQAWQLVQSSPDARDMFESPSIRQLPVVTGAKAAFEDIMTDVLASQLVDDPARRCSAARDAAQVLAAAMPGLKREAASIEELRRLIGNLLQLVLAGIAVQPPYAPAPVILSTSD